MVFYENQWLKKCMVVLNLNKMRWYERFKKIVQEGIQFFYLIFFIEGILYQFKIGIVDIEQKSLIQFEFV